MGEVVYYRGDNPPIEWSIIKMGSNIVTLQHADEVKVASFADVYRPSDVVYAPSTTQAQMSAQMPTQMPQQMPAGINFAPVINVGVKPTADTNVATEQPQNLDMFKNLVVKKLDNA